ncbi:PKD domain-containing protein [Shewanella violacea]|uniref:PKD domain-containing protein n=1 Tax=Shewanella violacea (strain JCM 10179 / CIP 106290 / LMG 19151 / DSS12) TaxID=637905 RepID=D4ZHB5_SHEVD|nr:PKD domain-containing protein [Shewanella violacea]BAJ01064.1 hypothetical protein SVI_1093 [Shewanella violacea DSS12]
MDYSYRLVRLALLSFSLSAIGLSGVDANAANPELKSANQSIESSAGHRTFPSVLLPEPANGEHAIGLLGSKLPDLASWYGMSTAQLAKMIREDTSVWLDKRGRIFYVEMEEPTEQSITEPLTTPETALNQEQTFKLHSKPGAPRSILLDFDGHTTIGTAWNNSYGTPIVSPAYNTEGVPETFTQIELDRIYLMWRQVAEDFAPFNVDVTTEDLTNPADLAIDPIARDTFEDLLFGTRVVITQNTFSNCGCGGFAYLRVFDDYGANTNYYKPAFVFNSSVVGAGEAITHEAGHNLGLNHDGQTNGTGYYTGHGSGATGWAPIMGVGYYQQLVQWSMNTYPLANQPQNDIQLIQDYGAPLMTDDHVDDMSIVNDVTAMTITSNGATDQLNGFGIIHLGSDQDMFKFDANLGNYSISVQTDDVSPNLDIEASLYDSNGVLLQTDNLSEVLSASLNGSFASAGTYFLKIDGVGKGDPLDKGYPDYGSLGQYIISATVQSVSNLQGPTAHIGAPSYLPDYAPVSVSFTSTGSEDDGTIVSYDWLFGDGTGMTTTDPVDDPVHEYLAPGEYTASLTVTDNTGLSDQDSIAVSVINRAPIAVIAGDPLTGQAPLQVAFDSTGSQDDDPQSSISFDWDFGDGASSTQATPSHLYSAAGNYTATLTVIDNLGASDSKYIDINVETPPFINQIAYGEIFTAGSVNGNYQDSALGSDASQTITERQSGGKKQNRYSYLTHTWLFSIASGNLVEIHLDASMSSPPDLPTLPDDQIILSYSVDNGASFSNFATLSNSDNGHYSATLPQDVSGEVRVKAEDSDQSAGNNTWFDSITIANLYIRSETDSSLTPPSAPTGLSTSSVSSSQINLTWLDNSTDESSFNIERSLNGTSWTQVQTLAAETTSYNDTGLSADTLFYYRVYASNGAGNSLMSNIATHSTQPASDFNLSASGYKYKGVKHIELYWQEYQTVDIVLDEVLSQGLTGISGADTAGEYYYDLNTGLKGGSSHSVQVCESGTSNCSDTLNIEAFPSL